MALINKLTTIGDAIRNKRGFTKKLTLDEMAYEIGLIEGGSYVPEVIDLQGNMDYCFANDRFRFLIDYSAASIKTDIG